MLMPRLRRSSCSSASHSHGPRRLVPSPSPLCRGHPHPQYSASSIEDANAFRNSILESHFVMCDEYTAPVISTSRTSFVASHARVTVEYCWARGTHTQPLALPLGLRVGQGVHGHGGTIPHYEVRELRRMLQCVGMDASTGR